MSQLARNWNSQQGLVVWSANQVKTEYEYAERLTAQASAYSKLPIEHASGTVYICRTEEDDEHNIRRIGFVNARDSGDLDERDVLLTNLAVAKLHDKSRENEEAVRNYIRKFSRFVARGKA
jgi:hypothetical protein